MKKLTIFFLCICILLSMFLNVSPAQADATATPTPSGSEPNTNWVIPTFDTAVFALSSINVSSGTNIVGNAGTNSIATGAVHIDNSGASINGSLFIGPGGTSSVVNCPSSITGSIINLSSPCVFPLPEFPAFPTDLPAKGALSVTTSQTINTDGYYTGITIGSGATLTFDVVSGTRKIKIDTLNVGYQGIRIVGSGTLILYVSTSMAFSSGTSVNPANPNPQPDKILIYYNGTNAVTFSSGSVTATLYASQASNITLSSGTSFIGNIISGGPLVTLSGGTSSYVRAIIAPNANVNMSGGVQLTGAIIANNFSASSVSVVTNNSNIIFPAALIQGSGYFLTQTPTPSATPTTTPTATTTPTVTNTPTATLTPLPTATNTPWAIATNTPRPTATDTPAPTSSGTPTNTPTQEPTTTDLPTATDTPVATITDSPTPTLMPEIVLGDINGNNEVSSADALMALQVVLGTRILTSNQKLAADVNRDGQITIADALMILQYSSGRLKSFMV